MASDNRAPIRNATIIDKPKELKTEARKVEAKKEGLGKKILHTFISSTPKEVGKSIVDDLVVPTVKKTLIDAAKGAVDMFLGGKTSMTVTSNQQTNYNGMYPARINRVAPMNRPQNGAPQGNPNVWYNDISYASKDDAQYVLEQLVDQIRTYQSVTISAVYDFSNLGKHDTATNQRYGWTSLAGASVIPNPHESGMWMINFPPPHMLDR